MLYYNTINSSIISVKKINMKVKLVFCIKSLIIGGVEKVLARYLSMIDFDIYEVDLLVIYNLAEANLLLKEIPSQVNVKYVLTKQQTVSAIKLIDNKKGLLDSLKYNLFRFKRNKLIENKIKQILTLDNNTQNKIIIDFNLYFKKPLSKVKQYPKIAFSHGNLSVINSNKQMAKHYNIYKNYDSVFVICAEMLSLAHKFFPDLSSKFKLGYNPINTDFMLKQAQQPIENYVLNSDYFVHVSRLEEDKDFTTLITGFKLFLAKYPQYKLYIIGGGSRLDYINNLIEVNNLADNVILLGQKSNPYPYIKNAKALILSTYSEGFPTVLVESLVLNTPIISTMVKTGIDELVNNPSCGLTFKLKDHNDLKNSLLEFVEDKELLKQINNNLPIKQQWIERNMTNLNSFYTEINNFLNKNQ